MWLRLGGCVACVVLAGTAGAAAESIAYDQRSGQWLFDPAMIVSRNDALYTSVSAEPWEAMPVGGGDLSAMVSCSGTSLELHLTKSDCWGFQLPPDAPPFNRFFNNVSPGHVRLVFGPQAKALVEQRFRQRLDLYHGRVVLELGPPESGARISVWGHPERKILIVELEDPRHALGPLGIELIEWRPTMQVTAVGYSLAAVEAHGREARPHLANTGMEDAFKGDPLAYRRTAVCVGVSSRPMQAAEATDNQTARLAIDADGTDQLRVVIAAAVASGEEALPVARNTLRAALFAPPEALKAEHQQWWHEWWDRSFLRIESPDSLADWLCAAYHVHLYTLACVNRGAVPCKWDGGAGLMRGDERTWGLAEWVQEIRFTYLPLYSANRLEMARGLTRHYTQMQPYLLEQTRRVWGVPGLWIPETVLPWGHAEDILLQDGETTGYLLRWDPASAPYGKFHRFNGYVGFLFTSGLEICHHYLLYYRYSGDEEFLRTQAYPTLRGVCEFISALLRRGDDGCYHLDPANALETWWLVRDPADTLSGVQAIFPEFIRLAEQYGVDAELREKCRAILAHLPEPSYGHWAVDGHIEPDALVYAPAAAKGTIPESRNFEIPALYRVFPFGLSGQDSPDADIARRTFERRIFGITNSWSLDAVWAARLGLGEKAGQLLQEHATRYNRFRYGGWSSSNSSVFPGDLSVVPYMDGAGLSAFAVQETLLQSHGGQLRILPAVPPTWSGIFRLRAEDGFLVAADFQHGKLRFAEIRSLHGKRCRLENPWPVTLVRRRHDQVMLRSDTPTIDFETVAAARYTIEPENGLVSTCQIQGIVDSANQQPGLPGRDR